MKSSVLKQTKKHSENIANRYYVDSLLGRGGMALVYKVHDSVTSQDIALKQLSLRKGHLEQDKAIELFEREYVSLMHLAHPRVIEVYDYGTDGSYPYYTMELLDGGDLRELSPVDWRRACTLLLDVCSVLSLMHSRRMVYRDLSPSNVRCTDDGLAKLIDFGAMIPTGPCRRVVGTPPFAAPEVVNLQVVDGRTDLYSLGATFYYTLTGRNAYPARDFSRLRQRWRTPPAPLSVLVKDIPRALDDLVMSLIQLDPVLRPANAAEVMERLSAIAEIELKEHLLVSQAYLTTPTLVARDKPLKRVRKQLINARQDRGGTLIVHGSKGMGRSRFIDACVLEGKLLGSIVIRADAADARAGDYGVVQAISRQLIDASADEAHSAAKYKIEILGHALPELLARFDNVKLKSFKSNFTLRPQVQDQIIEWLFEISQKQSLLIAIDDIDQADEPSAALIALLAHRLANRSIALIVSVESETLNSSNSATTLLAKSGTAIGLNNLSAKHTEELLTSVFGQVSQIKTLAHQLHKTTEGNPRDISQLAQHLVDRHVIRYRSGSWVIPDQIDTGDLPDNMAQTLKERVNALSPEALRLAQTIAFDPEENFSLEEFRQLSNTDLSRVLLSLDLLVAVDILRFDDERYTISQPGWVPALRNTCDAERERQIRLGLAAIYDARGQQDFRVVRHLLRANEIKRALDTLIAFSQNSMEETEGDIYAFYKLMQSLPADWFELYNEAIEIAYKHQRPLKDIFAMQSRLSTTVWIVYYDAAIYWSSIIGRFYQDCGLRDYDELDPGMEHSARLDRAFELAKKRYEQAAEEQRLFDPGTSIQRLLRTIISLLGPLGVAHDYKLWRSIPSLEPLAALSPALGIVEKLVKGVGHRIVNRSEKAIQTYQQILDRIDQPDHAELPETYYYSIRMGMIRVKGLIEASMGLDSSLQIAAELETHSIYEISSLQIQMLYYLWRGDILRAQTCRKNIELVKIQKNLPIPYVGSNLLREFLPYALTDDLTGVKPMLEQIEKMAQQYAAWVPTHHYAKAEYNRIRGDYHNALKELDRAREMTKAGECHDWAEINGAYLNTLLELERFEQARDIGREALRQADKAELGYVRNAIRMPLAIAHANLGEFDSAVAISQAVIDDIELLGSKGINLGLAYENRARVAIFMNDREVCHKYIKLCAEQFCDKENAALSIKYEKLVQEARSQLTIVKGEKRSDFLNISPSKRPVMRFVSETLLDSTEDQNRARRMLEMLIEYSQTLEGFLYFMKSKGPHLCAQIGNRPPSKGLDTMVRDFVAAELNQAENQTLTGTETSSLIGTVTNWTETDGMMYRPLLLGHFTESGYVVTGVAVLLQDPNRNFTFPADLIFAISKFLVDSGKVAIHFAMG